MPPLKQITIASGTPGEDSFRSTLHRHHQRIVRQHRLNPSNNANAPNSKKLMYRHERMPPLLCQGDLPTVHVGPKRVTATKPASIKTNALAARIRTQGKSNGSSVSMAESTKKAVENDTAVKERAPSVRPASYTESHLSTSKPGGLKKRRKGHQSRRRTIRISVPSKKKLQTSVRGGAHVQKALQTLSKQGLREVLAKNKLVKPGTKAPESLLRHIAAGVF